MSIHDAFHDEDHPMAGPYRMLEARLMSTGVTMSSQEREIWIATELAKEGCSSNLITSALLHSSPLFSDRRGEGVQDDVTRLVEAVMQLPEVRAARQARFGYDETVDEERMDDEDGAIFFGDF